MELLGASSTTRLQKRQGTARDGRPLAGVTQRLAPYADAVPVPHGHKVES
jgi:hypothetical protein